MLRFQAIPRYVIGIAVTLLIGAGTALAEPKEARLARIDLDDLDRATLAYFQGHALSTLTALSSLVSRADDARLDLIEERLGERKMPALRSLLAEARLRILHQGRGTELPKATMGEALLVLPELEDRVDKVIAAFLIEPAMDDTVQAPETVEEFEPLLWGVHVLTNQLASAESLARHMTSITKRLPKARASLSPDQHDVVQRDYRAQVENVRRLQQDVLEREMELRLERLALAKKALAKPELDKERFLAAFTSQLDGVVLRDFLKSAQKSKRPIQRATLRKEGLIQQVATDTKEANELAGDLVEKSQLLFQGLHWWYRGRYGVGPEVFGLAKSAEALRVPEAQFALYMPQSPPTPTDPNQLGAHQQPAPMYDRRHHYWWAWEDRRVIRSQSTTRKSFSSDTSDDDGTEKSWEITTSRFW